jgi:hypothetical protein
MWYNITLIMGMRGRDEHRNIHFGDIILDTNALNVEFLQFKERNSKTRDGAIIDENRATVPKIFCSCATLGAKKCPVELYKSFVSRRPVDYCEPDHPFYIQYKTEKQLHSSKSQVWFKREPLGTGSIGKFLPKACEIAGIPKRGNHGIRATTVQRLRKSGVPDDKIIQVTGHKSVKTLAVYDTEQLSAAEHQNMQAVLQGNAASTVHSIPGVSTPSAPFAPLSVMEANARVPINNAGIDPQSLVQNSVTLANVHTSVNNVPIPSAAGSMFSGAVFHNCNFYLQTRNASVNEG